MAQGEEFLGTVIPGLYRLHLRHNTTIIFLLPIIRIF